MPARVTLNNCIRYPSRRYEPCYLLDERGGLLSPPSCRVCLANGVSGLTVRLPAHNGHHYPHLIKETLSLPRMAAAADKSEVNQRKYLTSRQKLFKIFAPSYDRVGATQPNFVSFFFRGGRKNRGQVSSTLPLSSENQRFFFVAIKGDSSSECCIND